MSSKSDDPKAAAMKTRILTHMTTDHADSIALYLNHYCKLPISLTSPPPPDKMFLQDITLDSMIIQRPGGRSLVKIDPPMDNLSQARERLIEMHKECLRGLDLAEFKIERFVFPNKIWQFVIYLLVISTFVIFTMYPYQDFYPGQQTLPSKVYSFGGYTPWLAEFAAYVKDGVLLMMVAIHALEAGWFANNKLAKYWVPSFTPVWWAWEVAVFLGGVAAMWRFDDYVTVVEEERKAKAKREH